MKALILTALTLVPSPAFAAELHLSAINESAHQITVGSYRGWKLPSFCEKGASYGFCWEEVGSKLRPLNPDFRDLKRSAAHLNGSDFDHGIFIVIRGTVDGQEQVRQLALERCGRLSDDARGYYQAVALELEVDTQAVLRDGAKGICASGPRLHLQFR